MTHRLIASACLSVCRAFPRFLRCGSGRAHPRRKHPGRQPPRARRSIRKRNRPTTRAKPAGRSSSTTRPRRVIRSRRPPPRRVSARPSCSNRQGEIEKCLRGLRQIPRPLPRQQPLHHRPQPPGGHGPVGGRWRREIQFPRHENQALAREDRRHARQGPRPRAEVRHRRQGAVHHRRALSGEEEVQGGHRRLPPARAATNRKARRLPRRCSGSG